MAVGLCAKVAAKLCELGIGPGLDEGVDLGPLVNADTLSKVSSLGDSARADGAEVLTGGRAPDRAGYFYEPTVLDSVPADAGSLSAEKFGPVAPSVRVGDQGEAVQRGHGREVGPVAYPDSLDPRRAA